MRLYFIKQNTSKWARKHDYRIYKTNHSDTSKEVENIFDLGFLGVEKDYPEQISSLSIKKKGNRVNSRGKRVQQQNPF